MLQVLCVHQSLVTFYAKPDSISLLAPEVDLCNVTTLPILTNKWEMAFGLWNTTASGNTVFSAAGSGVGKYAPASPPQDIFDRDLGSDYISFGSCSNGTVSKSCGINTGFIVMPEQGTTLLLAIRLTTSRDISASDPLTITIEGSNGTLSALMLGKSWSLIYNGSTGLDVDPGRTTSGLVQCIINNAIWYASYRVLVTSKRGISGSVQYSEVKLFGHENPNKGKHAFICCLSSDFIVISEPIFLFLLVPNFKLFISSLFVIIDAKIP